MLDDTEKVDALWWKRNWKMKKKEKAPARSTIIAMRKCNRRKKHRVQPNTFQRSSYSFRANRKDLRIKYRKSIPVVANQTEKDWIPHAHDVKSSDRY